MRKLRLWEIPQFTLAKLLCGSRQGINKIGDQVPEDCQVRLWEEGTAVLCNQSSFRNLFSIPWSPPAPGTVVCSKLQSHRDVPLPDHIDSSIKLQELKKLFSIQHTSPKGICCISDSTEVWRHGGINPAKQTTRTWISQVPTMNSFSVMLAILGILPYLLILSILSQTPSIF